MKYPSDLTLKQWHIIKPLFEGEKRGIHFVKHSKRKLMDEVLYLVKTGCQWRQLPHDFPKWSSVKSFYYRALASGLWEKMRSLLLKRVELTMVANPNRPMAL